MRTCPHDQMRSTNFLKWKMSRRMHISKNPQKISSMHKNYSELKWSTPNSQGSTNNIQTSTIFHEELVTILRTPLSNFTGPNHPKNNSCYRSESKSSKILSVKRHPNNTKITTQPSHYTLITTKKDVQKQLQHTKYHTTSIMPTPRKRWTHIYPHR